MRMFQSKQTDVFSETTWDGETGVGDLLRVTVVAKLLLGGGRTASGRNQTNSKSQLRLWRGRGMWKK